MITIPITHCLRCGNELTYKEYRAKDEYCTPCQKVKADAETTRRQSEALGRANRVVRP